MKISIPKVRAYYAASPNEPEYLLCWIPAGELAQLASQGRVRPDILEYYPTGLEVEVSQQGLDEFELDLGASPEALRQAFKSLRKMGALPESGMVEAASLEQMIQNGAGAAGPLEAALPFVAGGKLPGPEMTDGEDPRTVMQQL
jgi:hypothetical protein